jgi:hypothetical protein
MLKANPHIADVRIFHRAVQYALDGNEFFTAVVRGYVSIDGSVQPYGLVVPESYGP